MGIRKIFLSISLILIIHSITYSQIPQFYEEEISHYFTEECLMDHITYLASEELEGRYPGSRGSRLAADYIAGEFRKYGLAPVGDQEYFQDFTILTRMLGERNHLILETGEDFNIKRDFIPYHFSTAGEVCAPVIFVGYGLSNEGHDDYHQKDVKGKIVIVLEGAPDGYSLDKKTKKRLPIDKIIKAQTKGAVGVIILGEPKTQNIYSPYAIWPGHIPPALAKKWSSPRLKGRADSLEMRVSHAISIAPKPEIEITIPCVYAKKDIFDKGISEASILKLKVDIKEKRIGARNVMGYIKGNGNLKKQVIIIGAHYDHLGRDKDGDICPGADDNASGVSALIQVADALFKIRHVLNRSILFIAFDGEEWGLLGSRYYTHNPVFPLKDTVVMLNLDTIGRNEPNQIYLIGSARNPDLKGLIKKVNEKIGMELLDTLEFAFKHGSDHYSFFEKDIPSIDYCSSLHADYHKTTDTSDAIIPEKASQVAKLVFLTSLAIVTTDVTFQRPREFDFPYPTSKAGYVPEKRYKIMAHDIQITLDLKRHWLKALDRLKIKPGEGKFKAFINRGLTIDSIKIDGQTLPFKMSQTYSLSDYIRDASDKDKEYYKNAALLEIEIPKELGHNDIFLNVSYQGVIYDELKVPRFSRDYIADQTTGLIGEEGVYLCGASHWYISLPDDLATYRLTTITPSPYEVVTEGKKIERTEASGEIRTVWDITHPLDALDLIAGKYQITQDDYKGIRIYTFFFPEESHLVPSYIGAVKKYLDTYEDLLGRYPFSKFAVVENFFPSGYGRPSFTLLGKTVIKLPFIVETSLGHEIVHGWWGNSVFVDYRKGNWSEGLTNYNADYLYKELKGKKEAIDYRRQINRDYSNYVHECNEFSLFEFIERTTPATRAIGYGKGAMVFHMLRRMIGDESFYGALRLIIKRNLYKRTSWYDFQDVFEEVSGKELDWFFDQWIKRKGAPFIKLGQVGCQKEAEGYRLDVEILQEGKPYILDIPMRIDLSSGEIIDNVYRIKRPKEVIHITVKSRPSLLVIDPDCHVFRRLHREEIPPLLSQVFGDEKQLVVIPTRGSKGIRKAYFEIAKQLTITGEAILKYDSEVNETELAENSLFLLGGVGENILVDRFISVLPKGVRMEEESFTLNGKRYDQEGSCLVVTLANRYNLNKGVTILFGLNPEGIRSVGRKITHYGKYSYLAFIDGKNTDKGIWAIKFNPLLYKFQPTPQ